MLFGLKVDLQKLLVGLLQVMDVNKNYLMQFFFDDPSYCPRPNILVLNVLTTIPV